jgi:hypothetical protein
MHMRGNRAQAIFCLVIRANIYAAFLIFSGEIISLHYQHMCRLFSAADILPPPMMYVAVKLLVWCDTTN